MLTPDAAKQQMKQWIDKDRNARLTGQVAQLAPHLRPTGYMMLGRMADGSEMQADWELYERQSLEAGAALDAARARDREQVFAVFFPKCAGAIEQTWQFLKGGTYQGSYARRPFRAPHSPEITLDARLTWLQRLVRVTLDCSSDVITPAWLAAWTPWLESDSGDYWGSIGRLLAAVIDGGGKAGKEVFDILRKSALNEHDIGGMGRHVTRALLLSSNPDGWSLVENLLLAAQRQEGLRQVILETVDESHPEAFLRMLNLIRSNKLTRFSSVVRAVNVWFGMEWDSDTPKEVNAAIDRCLRFLGDAGERDRALAGDQPNDAYSALWSIAYRDALASIEPAEKLLKHADAETRFAAVYHLSQLKITTAAPGLVAALRDPDLRVVFCAISGLRSYANLNAPEIMSPVFDSLEALYQRLPEKPFTLKPALWPWTGHKIERSDVIGALFKHMDRSPIVMLEYLPVMKPDQRSYLTKSLAHLKKWDEPIRQTVLKLVGDVASDVRSSAVAVLCHKGFRAEDAKQVEAYMTRTVSDLRQGVLKLLLTLSDAEAVSSAQRLLGARNVRQRLAGLELLRLLMADKRAEDESRKTVADYRDQHPKLSLEEEVQLGVLEELEQPPVTRENALGLIDPADCTPAIAPRKLRVQAVTPATIRILKALDKLFHEHRETMFQVTDWEGRQVEVMLGNDDGWGLPCPSKRQTREENRKRFPLAEVCEDWWNNRPASLRDRDGLEIIRAQTWFEMHGDKWKTDEFRDWVCKSEPRKAIDTFLSGKGEACQLKYGRQVENLLDWRLYLYPVPPETIANFRLDMLEHAYSLIPDSDVQSLTRIPQADDSYYREYNGVKEWREFRLINSLSQIDCELSPAQHVRHWQLLRWWERPVPGAPRLRANFLVIAGAFLNGGATPADLYDTLLGYSVNSLYYLTQHSPCDPWKEFLDKSPEAREIVIQCGERILELELARGESESPATPLISHLKSLWSIDSLVRILTALGSQGFKKRRYYGEGSAFRIEMLTQLASITYPRSDETPDQFVRVMRAAIAAGKFPERRLLELSFLAPQWSRFIERYLKWPGYLEGLYWFLAHMQYVYEATEKASIDIDTETDDDSNGGRHRSAWERLVLERTPLSNADREAGAIDIAWFRRTYAQLSPKRWQALADAARFAATPQQARRAQYIADVLLGKANRAELIEGVLKKRLKDSVRLLGLLPLAKGAKRSTDLAERYRALQEYRRYAKGLGMSKADALQAVEIGLKNLAATADYADPLRLEWALEAEAVRDLRTGSITVQKGDVTVRLEFDDRFDPQLVIHRDGKSLKSVPPAVKKERDVAALLARRGDLRKQTSQIRSSLETAMCRGDEITGAELAQLADHALLAPLLQRLILVGDEGMGYPDRRGKTLRDHSGAPHSIRKAGRYRIAHSVDLHDSGEWPAWQHECFRAERLQPFKQVFRELYLPTKQERADSPGSQRYTGQQVNPQQAHALWGQRGWNTQDEVFKTYHHAGLTVNVDFRYGGGTPLEVEGLTLDTITFLHRDKCGLLPLKDVPPRLFSESMRDIDLVVSVAHRGAVDPEASASTVDMRAALVHETALLLALDNVRLKSPFVLIDGQLNHYSLHLGSGNVSRMPGGSVCIVPVDAQHRGRLFLPFADNDPRTAEVISKILLLAHDDKIQDPTILEQIRG